VQGVSCSPALKWLIILLLPVTLGWKLVARQGGANEPHENPQVRVAEFLVRQHFTVIGPTNTGDSMVRAAAGPCQIAVTQSDTIGWRSSEIRSRATSEHLVFFVVGGKVYAEQPTWLTVSRYLWFRFQRELGFKVQAMPVFAVIAGKSCDAERLPWAQLH
jgi:hypothetical protein